MAHCCGEVTSEERGQKGQLPELRSFRGARSVFICQNGPPSDVAHVLRELPDTTLTLSVSDTVPSVGGSCGTPTTGNVKSALTVHLCGFDILT